MNSDIDWFDIDENEWKNQNIDDMDRTHLVNSILYLKRAIKERKDFITDFNLYRHQHSEKYIKDEISDMTLILHKLINELERQS